MIDTEVIVQRIKKECESLKAKMVQKTGNLVVRKYEIRMMRMNEKKNDWGQLEKGIDVTTH